MLWLSIIKNVEAATHNEEKI